MAQWVFGVFSSRDPELMITVYKTLVRSLMEYCSPLWSPQTVGDIQLLESVQRGFTAKVSGMKNMDYWQRLKALDLMSLQRRRDRYAVLTMHKTYRGLIPNETGIAFNRTSRHGVKADIPDLSRVKSKRTSTLYSSSFGSIGPRLWNCLPDDLREIEDPDLFKFKLDLLLRDIPDRPPTAGYQAPNRNSLSDWWRWWWRSFCCCPLERALSLGHHCITWQRGSSQGLRCEVYNLSYSKNRGA